MAAIDPNETLEFPEDHGSWPPVFGRRQGLYGTIDRLVDLMTPELDAEILAGFKPSVERADGPGLRHAVIEAIGARLEQGRA
jgi:hypothetical protein